MPFFHKKHKASTETETDTLETMVLPTMVLPTIEGETNQTEEMLPHVPSPIEATAEDRPLDLLEQEEIEPSPALVETAEEVEIEADPPANQPKKSKRVLKTLGILALALCLVWGGMKIVPQFLGKQTDTTQSNYQTASVTRQDITSSLGSKGTLTAAQEYTVTTSVGGAIVTANVKEGDMVSKDSVLFQLDNTTVLNDIERAELALNNSQRNYNTTANKLQDYTVSAQHGGMVTSLSVSVGDSIGAGQSLGTLADSSSLLLTIPFLESDAVNLYVGATATVTLEGTFETLTGSISDIEAGTRTLSGNRIVRHVTIALSNPGSLTPEHSASATIGDIASADTAKFTYKHESTITSTVGGKVTQVCQKGAVLQAGDTLLHIDTSDVQDNLATASASIKESALQIQSQKNRLDDYVIRAPITGTVVHSASKVGDNIVSGGTLCTIYDLSYLRLTMNIDELDIPKVSVGQRVSITAQAQEGITYGGTVANINIKPDSASGVTTYPVTVYLDQAEGLLPGMNVEAKIVLSEQKDVLSIPAVAVLRGNQVIVQDNAPKGEDQSLPAGYRYQTVVLGESNGTEVQILDGLQEGQTVFYEPSLSEILSTMQEMPTEDFEGGGDDGDY